MLLMTPLNPDQFPPTARAPKTHGPETEDGRIDQEYLDQLATDLTNARESASYYLSVGRADSAQVWATLAVGYATELQAIAIMDQTATMEDLS
jgi:hypothetical protein